MFDSIADITFSSKLMVALRTLCSSTKNSDTCFDLELVRAVGASVFRQLFAQLSSEVAHFTHPYYFEATSCSTFYPSCTLRAFLGLKRELLRGVVFGRDTSAKSDYREGVLLRPCFVSGLRLARLGLRPLLVYGSRVGGKGLRYSLAGSSWGPGA